MRVFLKQIKPLSIADALQALFSTWASLKLSPDSAKRGRLK
jgi:hypothetical protein